MRDIMKKTIGIIIFLILNYIAMSGCSNIQQPDPIVGIQYSPGQFLDFEETGEVTILCAKPRNVQYKWLLPAIYEGKVLEIKNNVLKYQAGTTPYYFFFDCELKLNDGKKITKRAFFKVLDMDNPDNEIFKNK